MVAKLPSVNLVEPSCPRHCCDHGHLRRAASGYLGSAVLEGKGGRRGEGREALKVPGFTSRASLKGYATVLDAGSKRNGMTSGGSTHVSSAGSVGRVLHQARREESDECPMLYTNKSIAEEPSVRSRLVAGHQDGQGGGLLLHVSATTPKAILAQNLLPPTPRVA